MEELLAKIESGNVRLAIVGMGYVGLPLAVEFGRLLPTLGFDIKERRIAELRAGRDSTLETTPEQLQAAAKLRFSSDPADLRGADIYIVAVPTPIDSAKQPDLAPLLGASRTVGQAMGRGALVIFESTVYPGCTEEDCVPVLERESGLVFNRDFHCGYSPERINPGDHEHRLATIVKVTSGSTPEAGRAVDALYRLVVKAGTHPAPSIRVAEAAKIIENCQRDINIAFVNELAMIFDRMGIDTHDVLAAAGTKWNFLRFSPGLVGGHCIGVDPFYLTHKAQQLGHHPQIILAGRRTNDGMGRYVASRVVKLLIHRGHAVNGARILLLGITFKQDCPDIRNSRVVDVIDELAEYGCQLLVCDPWADPAEVKREYGLELISDLASAQALAGAVDGVILAVSHREFLGLDLAPFRAGDAVVYDIKGFLPREQVDGRL
ncbi:MAG: nucleotide sugar dehydrogenase [Lentisphaeria bacterium]|jgi:UDP-N-acetyl-D-galactosamine dehydrogenase|nr:nucleotide sugar dehydrogenase [Lentisphaeria bacterium]